MSAPVLISGAGIGGMAAALALKRSKIPFIILEQSKKFEKTGGGIGLWGPALKRHCVNLVLNPNCLEEEWYVRGIVHLIKLTPPSGWFGLKVAQSIDIQVVCVCFVVTCK